MNERNGKKTGSGLLAAREWTMREKDRPDCRKVNRIKSLSRRPKHKKEKKHIKTFWINFSFPIGHYLVYLWSPLFSLMSSSLRLCNRSAIMVSSLSLLLLLHSDIHLKPIGGISLYIIHSDPQFHNWCQQRWRQWWWWIPLLHIYRWVESSWKLKFFLVLQSLHFGPFS